MNYYEIGQRIRRIRKARGFSQEQLAEMAGISVTHMSHIETANTKLSLSVFVERAKALEVQTDVLLYDVQQDNTSKTIETIACILEGCTARQARIIEEIVRTTKQAFDAYL